MAEFVKIADIPATTICRMANIIADIRVRAYSDLNRPADFPKVAAKSHAGVGVATNIPVDCPDQD